MPVEFEWGQISVGVFVGTVIGLVVGHRLALGRDRIKEFQEAGGRFRESFVELRRLLALRHPNHVGGRQEFQKAFKLMQKYYTRLYEAKFLFEPYLSATRKKKFQRAWDEFCCVEGDPQHPTFSDYKSSANHMEELAKRDLAIKRIEKLFKFTR